MAGAKEIRSKIASVQNTQKITPDIINGTGCFTKGIGNAGRQIKGLGISVSGRVARGIRAGDDAAGDVGGMTKQTVNSALRRMEGDGLIYLESAGRGKDVCLTPEGEALVQRTARRVIQAENQVFAAWPQEDVEQYLALTRRFQEALAQKAREIKEKS